MDAIYTYRDLQSQLDESADALEGLRLIIAVLGTAEAMHDPIALERVSLALTLALAECARRIDGVSAMTEAFDPT